MIFLWICSYLKYGLALLLCYVKLGGVQFDCFQCLPGSAGSPSESARCLWAAVACSDCPECCRWCLLVAELSSFLPWAQGPWSKVVGSNLLLERVQAMLVLVGQNLGFNAPHLCHSHHRWGLWGFWRKTFWKMGTDWLP